MTFDAPLTPELSLTSTSYYHRNKGQGSWITPYVGIPAGAPDGNGGTIATASPLSYHTIEYGIERAGNVHGGWKGMRVENSAELTTDTLVAGKTEAEDWFLPQLGAVFRLGRGAEVFASYTENMRAFVSSATSGPFATMQIGFDAIRSTLKPETSKTGEGGVRLRTGGLQLSTVDYYVDFDLRRGF